MIVSRDEVAQNLPYLRRYARALCGDQTTGDTLVANTLQSVLSGALPDAEDRSTRTFLYRLFTNIWMGDSAAPTGGTPAEQAQATAVRRLYDLPEAERVALLLSSLEGFSADEVASIIRRDRDRVEMLVAQALHDIRSQLACDVLIIEDDAGAAFQLKQIVTELGHVVTGVATTKAEALAEAKASEPGLILADIQLADGSSGVDAVDLLMESFAAPTVFVTGYPERLLTGERREPTFLVSKPFSEETVISTIGQALFFKSGKAPG